LASIGATQCKIRRSGEPPVELLIDEGSLLGGKRAAGALPLTMAIGLKPTPYQTTAKALIKPNTTAMPVLAVNNGAEDNEEIFIKNSYKHKESNRGND